MEDTGGWEHGKSPPGKSTMEIVDINGFYMEYPLKVMKNMMLFIWKIIEN